jgi:UDP-2,4-diacetamido-2,4,6-trideoxy-beta-L-altropyranose hydrolase
MGGVSYFPGHDKEMKLLMRADGDAQIGAGHVMRCLALGQAWQDAGGQVVLAMATKIPTLETRLQQEGMEVIHLSVSLGSADDALQTAHLAREQQADWLVADGYLFGADYQRFMKESGLRLLLIDDYGHATHYYADWVLNQNIHAHPGIYAAKELYTRLLLGTQYALLRREFWQWRGWQRQHPEVAGKILITLGGSDPDNVTGKVLQSLGLVKPEGLKAVVVVGGANLRYQSLEGLAGKLNHHVRLVVNALNMPELMAWADLAISAGGSTCWELAFMGLPMMTLVLAENQEPIAESLDRAGVALNLGWHNQLSAPTLAATLTCLLSNPEARGRMSRKGHELIDGAGAYRVVERLYEKKM